MLSKQQKLDLGIETVQRAVTLDQSSDYLNAIQSYNTAISLFTEVLAGVKQFIVQR
jgi:hypothetical protein